MDACQPTVIDTEKEDEQTVDERSDEENATSACVVVAEGSFPDSFVNMTSRTVVLGPRVGV